MIQYFISFAYARLDVKAIGTSVNAICTLNEAGPVGQVAGGLGWGMALTAAIYVCGGVSGGHGKSLDSSIHSLAQSVTSKSSWIGDANN